MSDMVHEDIDPETGWSRCVIQLMASAVSEVRDRKPASWALFSIDGIPRLNIGKRNVCIMYKDRIELFVNVQAINRMRLNRLGISTQATPVRDYPEGGRMTFPISASPEIVARVHKSYLAMMRNLARLSTDPDFQKLHDEELRIKLNEVAGVQIKSPAYTGYRPLKR